MGHTLCMPRTYASLAVLDVIPCCQFDKCRYDRPHGNNKKMLIKSRDSFK